MHILLLEDDEDMAESLGEVLMMDGHTVHHGRNGQDGEAYMAETTKPPDAIICDLRMPGMDGFEFIQWLRQQKQYAHLPVIVMSGASQDRRDALNSGGSFFLMKPFTYQNLQAILSDL